MAYSASDLSSRIEIYKITTLSVKGFPVTSEALDRATYAKAIYVSDGEKFRMGSIKVDISIRFIIRKQPLEHTSRIKFNGTVYEIKGIKPVQDQEKKFLEVTCGAVK